MWLLNINSRAEAQVVRLELLLFCNVGYSFRKHRVCFALCIYINMLYIYRRDVFFDLKATMILQKEPKF